VSELPKCECVTLKKRLFFLDCLTLEDKGTTFLWNIRIHSRNNIVSHPRDQNPQHTELFLLWAVALPCWEKVTGSLLITQVFKMLSECNTLVWIYGLRNRHKPSNPRCTHSTSHTKLSLKLCGLSQDFLQNDACYREIVCPLQWNQASLLKSECELHFSSLQSMKVPIHKIQSCFVIVS
jgi:hypothetical protein